MLDSAVLFLIFNRPEITNRVFQEIRSAKPKRLYVAADGPRRNYEEDVGLCERTREICTQIDWDCEVKTNFQKENLGCRVAVSSAINWFFDNEEEGIILEDDCLPSQSFFDYCDELLERYRNDKRVMCISGSNYQQGQSVTGDSYYFSKYNHCTGWASWRRSWTLFDKDMLYWEGFRESGGLVSLSDGNDEFIQYWTKIFNSAASGEVDSWAYRWTFSCWVQSGLTCLPKINLVKHTGYGADATHTKSRGDWRSELEAEDLSFPLMHPKIIVRNIIADKYTDAVIFGIEDNTFYKYLKKIYTYF